MSWDFWTFTVAVAAMPMYLYGLLTLLRRQRDTAAVVVTQAVRIADLRARMDKVEHLAHMALMAHAGLCKVTYHEGEGFDDATIAAAFEPVVDRDELRRTGTTPIRGFRHRLYDDDPARDTADEQENDEQMAREMWSPGE